MSDDAPLFSRHCSACTPLGRYRWSRAGLETMDFDLYHCVDHHPRSPIDYMPTLVARFGHEDEQEFLSTDIARSLFAGQPHSAQATALAEALKRAMRRRLPLLHEDLDPGGPARS